MKHLKHKCETPKTLEIWQHRQPTTYLLRNYDSQQPRVHRSARLCQSAWPVAPQTILLCLLTTQDSTHRCSPATATLASLLTWP
jgi:hypothetical protein